MGNNANDAVKKILSLLASNGKNIPSMVSITSIATGEFDEFEDCNYEELASQGSSELKTVI
jgi:hypothetical protein